MYIHPETESKTELAYTTETPYMTTQNPTPIIPTQRHLKLTPRGSKQTSLGKMENHEMMDASFHLSSRSKMTLKKSNDTTQDQAVLFDPSRCKQITFSGKSDNAQKTDLPSSSDNPYSVTENHHNLSQAVQHELAAERDPKNCGPVPSYFKDNVPYDEVLPESRTF